MEARYRVGQQTPGSLWLTFGRHPAGSQYRVDEDFREIYWRLYLKHEPGFEGSPGTLAAVQSIWAADLSDTVRVTTDSSGPFLFATGLRCVDDDSTPICLGNWMWEGRRQGPVLSAQQRNPMFSP